MSEFPDGLRYTEEHEYLTSTGESGVYRVGITDYAQGELGDIVFLELPTIGETFNASDVIGTIEAVKAVSDIYCPIGGEVLAVNLSLEDDPALVNADPYGDGWMVRLKASDLSELDDMLNVEAYRTLVEK